MRIQPIVALDWQPVRGFAGYLVHPEGRVVCTAHKSGPRELRPFMTGSGRRYPTVTLMVTENDKRVKKTVLISLLVIQVFGPPKPAQGPWEVRAIDGNPGNVRYDNLVWALPTANPNRKYSKRPKFGVAEQ